MEDGAMEESLRRAKMLRKRFGAAQTIPVQVAAIKSQRDYRVEMPEVQREFVFASSNGADCGCHIYVCGFLCEYNIVPV